MYDLYYGSTAVISRGAIGSTAVISYGDILRRTAVRMYVQHLPMDEWATSR